MEEAGRNIRRNGLMSVAALTTVIVSMAVLGGALFGLLRLQQFAEAQQAEFEIAVFVQKDLPREKVLEVQARIRALPGVAFVGLYPKEQALAQLQREDAETGTGLATALGEENPLPDRLDVRLHDPRRTKVIAAILSDPAQFPEVHTVRDARDILDKVLATSRLITHVGGVLSLSLFIATAFVIQNTIRLTVFARRREIRIMQLVGATPSFIRLPLVLEGIFYGVFGAALAGCLVLFIAHQLSLYTQKFETPLAQAMPPTLGPHAIIGLLAAIGALVGWSGSLLSIRRFLKRI